MATEENKIEGLQSPLEPTHTPDELSTTPAPLDAKRAALDYYKWGEKLYDLGRYRRGIGCL